MENHRLGIGDLKTDCSVLAYPQAVAALRSTMERALAGPFAGRLASAVEPVLDGHEGVIRIRTIQLDFAHSGPWDESILADLLAARFVLALRKALESRPSEVRAWPDPVAYMASYVEMRLGFSHEPAWAFPDFEALRLLPPVQAVVEIVKARPVVLIALSDNGRRSGNAWRFVERLDRAAAEHLVDHLLAEARAAFANSGLPASPLLVEPVVDILRRMSGVAADAAILRLICEAGARAVPQDMPLLIATAALAVGLSQIAATFERRYRRVMTVADLGPAIDLAGVVLAPHLASFTSRMAGQVSARPVIERLFALLSEEPLPQTGARSRDKRPTNQGKAKSLHLSSPFAGLALLLPDAVRLSLHRQLGVNGLRQALLSIPDADMAARAETDALIDFLYPESHETGEPTFPPVPETAIARLAPESRRSISGRQGGAGWGDLLLASFASRLPGLRASSRAYLQRQFFAVSGRADIIDAAILVTLDGPPLSIILKMAGLSGDQMPVPHLDNRLLVLDVGGAR